MGIELTLVGRGRSCHQQVTVKEALTREAGLAAPIERSDHARNERRCAI